MKTWRMLALIFMGICLVGGVVGKLWNDHYKGEATRNWENFQAQVEVTERMHKAAEVEKAALRESIALLQGEMDSTYTIIAEQEEALVGKEADIHALKQLRPLLSTKDEIIANLDAQVQQYEQVVFTLKAKDVEKDKIIFNLTEQGKAKDRLVLVVEGQLLQEKELRSLALDGWRESAQTVDRLRRTGRLTRSVFVGSASVALSSQLQGASLLSSFAFGAVVSTVTYLLWH